MFFFSQEEKWYSSALKEEVDKLESEKQERLEAYQKLEQVSLYLDSLFIGGLEKNVFCHGERFSLTEDCFIL